MEERKNISFEKHPKLHVTQIESTPITSINSQASNSILPIDSADSDVDIAPGEDKYAPIVTYSSGEEEEQNTSSTNLADGGKILPLCDSQEAAGELSEDKRRMNAKRIEAVRSGKDSSDIAWDTSTLENIQREKEEIEETDSLDDSSYDSYDGNVYDSWSCFSDSLYIPDADDESELTNKEREHRRRKKKGKIRGLLETSPTLDTLDYHEHRSHIYYEEESDLHTLRRVIYKLRNNPCTGSGFMGECSGVPSQNMMRAIDDLDEVAEETAQEQSGNNLFAVVNSYSGDSEDDRKIVEYGDVVGPASSVDRWDKVMARA